jgi:cargo-transport protein YPP1
MTHSDSDKAARYMQSLDNARCTGQWHEVPELARKVAKHAPHRKTLALVARSEATISCTEVSKLNATLAPLIKPLQDVIEKDKAFPEDVFQATACLGWIYWLLQEHKSAAATLDVDPHVAISSSSSTSAVSSPQWVLVCASKQAYIRGFSLEKLGDFMTAARAYQSGLSFLLVSSPPNNSLASKPQEFRLWTERLLCRFVSRHTRHGPIVTTAEFDQLLLVFHLWGFLFNYQPTDQQLKSSLPLRTPPPDFQLGLEVEFSRWDMWMAYYETLSQILRLDFIYSPTYTDSSPHIIPSGEELTDDEYLAARLKQRTELKSVEAKIEGKLLVETSFPKANIRNDRVEKWVDAVMENWRLLCGDNWNDAELGAGGKNAIARGVLDILYRAATKTFHSTQILRHLFIVHAYTAEFNLAMKALDTYLELVTRARARSAKSGDIDFSLDENDQVLLTMADAIAILCRFGQREDAEKARHIAGKLKIWVHESEIHPEITESESAVNGHSASSIKQTASLSTVARAYHALGMSEAHWGRLTYEASSRTQHQNKAQEYYRLALHRKYRNSKNLDYLYSLAILLAEMRDITGALKITKLALAESSAQTGNDERYAIERKSIRFWHLLTLLLSSRTDYLNAAKASTAAFEQFKDMGTLFGEQQYRSEHLNESEKLSLISPALVDHMGTIEKIGILQVKMTQVALLEALEGANQAVDASLDLLALYVRLFGHPPGQKSLKTNQAAQKLPKSRIGSIRASIFKRAVSRKGNSRLSVDQLKIQTRPPTAATSTTAPTIQVTDLSASVASELRGRTMNGTRSNGKVDSINSGGKAEIHRSRSRSKANRKNSFKTSMDTPPTESTLGSTTNEKTELNSGKADENNVLESSQGSSVPSTKRPSTASSIESKSTSFSSYRNSRHRKRDSRVSMQTIESDGGGMDLALVKNPVPFVPDLVDRRYRTSTLVELWLFISGMYCRSDIFEEAKDAIDEAEQLVVALELEIARLNSSAKAYSNPGWGAGKCVDELRGDILTQVSSARIPVSDFG